MWWSYIVAAATGMGLGAVIRLVGLPTASPPTAQGVLVVAALTAGWWLAAKALG
jgi:hypothetical protein